MLAKLEALGLQSCKQYGEKVIDIVMHCIGAESIGNDNLNVGVFWSQQRRIPATDRNSQFSAKIRMIEMADFIDGFGFDDAEISNPA